MRTHTKVSTRKLTAYLHAWYKHSLLQKGKTEITATINDKDIRLFSVCHPGRRDGPDRRGAGREIKERKRGGAASNQSDGAHRHAFEGRPMVAPHGQFVASGSRAGFPSSFPIVSPSFPGKTRRALDAFILWITNLRQALQGVGKYERGSRRL